jgi:hypothetical protein
MTSNVKLIEQNSHPNLQETHYCSNSICMVELIVLVCPIFKNHKESKFDSKSKDQKMWRKPLVFLPISE